MGFILVLNKHNMNPKVFMNIELSKEICCINISWNRVYFIMGRSHNLKISNHECWLHSRCGLIPFITKPAVQSEAVTHSKHHLIAHNYRYKCCAHSVGLLQNIERRACLLLWICVKISTKMVKSRPCWIKVSGVYIYSVSKFY